MNSWRNVYDHPKLDDIDLDGSARRVGWGMMSITISRTMTDVICSYHLSFFLLTCLLSRNLLADSATNRVCLFILRFETVMLINEKHLAQVANKRLERERGKCIRYEFISSLIYGLNSWTDSSLALDINHFRNRNLDSKPNSKGMHHRGISCQRCTYSCFHHSACGFPYDHNRLWNFDIVQCTLH